MDRARRHDLTAMRLELDSRIVGQPVDDTNVGRLAHVEVKAAAPRPDERSLGQAEVRHQPRQRIVVLLEVTGIDIDDQIGVTQANADVAAPRHPCLGTVQRERRRTAPSLFGGSLSVNRDQIMTGCEMGAQGRRVVLRRRFGDRRNSILVRVDVELDSLLQKTRGRAMLPGASVFICEVAHRASSPRMKASRSAML